ncbi:hypothetical protein DAPPUDRAFT_107776 [Daphnia pulex]|uniref:Uncharacterized protein n=1 Tax=Daphnia pulex TaxID=6669 RepID=E9GY73_DAPPU|nr:hypothetical protein DAPPUDRAFT_107776 [Daphnia pulex]|eukprot:EFX75552.1 hypothetical protein DAPPUDRAFT_107776 [Daphnia pulex]
MSKGTNNQAKADLVQTHTEVENVKKELNEMKVSAPSSIGRGDLQKIGHTKSGLFSVIGNKTVDNVYCDFTKPINGAGNAMNTSGIFVAPTPDKYFFSYSGLSYFGVLARVVLQVNTATANWVRIGQVFGNVGAQTFSLKANLELAKGDQIRLLLLEGGILDDENHYTNFVGQREEDIIQ